MLTHYTPDTSLARYKFSQKLQIVALALAILIVAATLRLLWVEDMEYKTDEQWSFAFTRMVANGEPMPTTGMPTSHGVRHPPGNVWVLVGLSEAFQVQTPTDLGRACQLLNVAAFVLLAWFIVTSVPANEREQWWWGMALAAVNPLALLFHRKIWPPSLAPLFVVLLLIAWWYRDRRFGALVWGGAGMLLGLIHPVGLLLAGGLALWAVLFERQRSCWRWWLAGSFLLVPLYVPWLHYLWTHPGDNIERGGYWMHVAELKFWTRWVTEPLGISLHYSLGADFGDFLQSPWIGAQPTYLMGAAHLVLLVGGVWLGLRGLCQGWHDRADWRRWFADRASPTGFTVAAMLWGFGLLLTFTGLPLYRHYMVLTFPLMYVWLARFALRPGERCGRVLLFALCVAQAIISVGFLHYIHHHSQPIQGDYGTPYSAQGSP